MESNFLTKKNKFSNQLFNIFNYNYNFDKITIFLIQK